MHILQKSKSSMSRKSLRPLAMTSLSSIQLFHKGFPSTWGADKSVEELGFLGRWSQCVFPLHSLLFGLLPGEPTSHLSRTVLFHGFSRFAWNCLKMSLKMLCPSLLIRARSDLLAPFLRQGFTQGCGHWSSADAHCFIYVSWPVICRSTPSCGLHQLGLVPWPFWSVLIFILSADSSLLKNPALLLWQVKGIIRQCYHQILVDFFRV